MSDLKVYIPERRERVDLETALSIINEKWVDNGKYSDATILDLVDCLRLLANKPSRINIAIAASKLTAAAKDLIRECTDHG